MSDVFISSSGFLTPTSLNKHQMRNAGGRYKRKSWGGKLPIQNNSYGLSWMVIVSICLHVNAPWGVYPSFRHSQESCVVSVSICIPWLSSIQYPPLPGYQRNGDFPPVNEHRFGVYPPGIGLTFFWGETLDLPHLFVFSAQGKGKNQDISRRD